MKIHTLLACSVLGMTGTSMSVAALMPAAPSAPASPADDSPVEAVVPQAAGLVEFGSESGLHVQAWSGHPAVPLESSFETYLLVDVQPAAAAAPATQDPIHTVVVVDASGSMKGVRLDNAKRAAEGMVRRLRSQDLVTVLAYDTQVRTVIGPVRASSRIKDEVGARLSAITARGNTCMSCAVKAATERLAQTSGSLLRHVVLLSDGEPTAGDMSVAAFQKLGVAAAKRDVSISSIGVDLSYDERLLSALSARSNGQHHFARSAADLPGIFDKEVGALLGTVGKDVRVTVELANGVELVRAFDRPVERSGRVVRARLGTLAEGDKKTLLLKVRAKLAAAGPLASVRVEHSAGGNRSVGEAVLIVGAAKAGGAGDLIPAVAARVQSSETARLLRDSGLLLRTGRAADFAKLDSKLRKQLARLDRLAAKSAGPGKRPASASIKRQRVAIAATRKKASLARGMKCGCATGDLMCAMRCSASPAEDSKASKESFETAHPLSK